METQIKEEHLRELLKEYDYYIQQANEEDKYKTGWKPVCIMEFYNNEFQEIDITRFLKMLLELSEETKVFDRLIISLFNMLSE